MVKALFGADTVPTDRNNLNKFIPPSILNGSPLNIKSNLPIDNYLNLIQTSIDQPTGLFQDLSIGAQIATFLANEINNGKNSRNDRLKYVKELQPDYQENFNSQGLNNIPLYTKYGGSPSIEKAKEILRDGTANGKKLTDKQKKYFGFIAGGGKPKAKYGIENKLLETGGLPDRSMATIEAERGEVYQQPDGTILKISDSANSHENGGVPINNVERVLEDTSTTRNDKISKSLKVNKNTFQTLFGIPATKDMSHSEALEKADVFINKQTNKVQNSLKNSMNYLNINPNDIYSKNSLNLNSKKLNDIPTRGDVFDTLFEHQEFIKNMLNIDNQKAQYGKYLPKAATGTYNDITLGKADKSGGRTPTGKNNMDFDFTQAQVNNYAKQLGLRTDNNKNFQSDLYDFVSMLPNGQNILNEMWSEFGNTRKGITSKQNNNKEAFVDGDIKARTKYLLSRALQPPQVNLSALPIPEDNTFIPPPVDSITPSNILSVPFISESQVAPQQPFTMITRNQREFNEPLQWYDLAGPLGALTSAEAIPTNFNPAEFNKIRLKRQNPLPTLQAGQRDFNAVLNMLPSNGSGMANANNLFASKYALNNQVLGQYENINNQIDNQEITYNANVADRQSLADQQARDVFEQKYLGTQEAVRQQKLKAFDDIYTRIAENAKLNREGNLLMKMFPNFNQYGEYNGNPFIPRTPVGIGANSGVRYITDPNNGSRYRVIYDANGKPISSSKVIADNKAVGVKSR